MPTIPSKRDLDEKNEFPLLPHDDYKLVVENVEARTEVNKFYVEPVEGEKVKKNQKKEVQVVNITFNIVSLKDGSPAYDEKGKSTEKRKLWFKAKPESFGFMADGTPSKTRCFIAFITGQDIYGELQYNRWEDFVGEEICAEIMQKPVGIDKRINVISRFLPQKRMHQPTTSVDMADIPVIEENGDGGYNGEVKFPPEKDEIDIKDVPF